TPLPRPTGPARLRGRRDSMRRRPQARSSRLPPTSPPEYPRCSALEKGPDRLGRPGAGFPVPERDLRRRRRWLRGEDALRRLAKRVGIDADQLVGALLDGDRALGGG